MLDKLSDVLDLLFPHVAILAMPFVLGIIMLLALILLVLKKWKWSVFPLIVAVIANNLTETFAINFQSGKCVNGIRVMTYNMLSDSDYMREHGDNPLELCEMLLNQKADVICLQEYDTIVCGQLKEILGRSYPYFALMPKMSQESAVFSKLPIKDFKQVDGILVNEVTLDREGKNIELFVCHLFSNHYDDMRKEVGDSLKWHERLVYYFKGIKHSGEMRTGGAMAVKEKVDLCIKKGMPVIVCGDMNDVGGSRPLRILQDDGMLSDAWWEKGFGFGFTYHGHQIMRFRLDHILYTQDFKCCGVKVIRQDFSDHDPLVAVFKLK